MNLSKVKNTPGMHHWGDHTSDDWIPVVPAMQSPAHPAVPESPCLQNVQHQWGPPLLPSKLPHVCGWQTIPTQMLHASESCSAGWMGHGSSHHWQLAVSGAAMPPPGGIIYTDDTAHSSLSPPQTQSMQTHSLSISLQGHRTGHLAIRTSYMLRKNCCNWCDSCKRLRRAMALSFSLSLRAQTACKRCVIPAVSLLLSASSSTANCSSSSTCPACAARVFSNAPWLRNRVSTLDSESWNGEHVLLCSKSAHTSGNLSDRTCVDSKSILGVAGMKCSVPHLNHHFYKGVS